MSFIHSERVKQTRQSGSGKGRDFSERACVGGMRSESARAEQQPEGARGIAHPMPHGAAEPLTKGTF